MGEIRTILEEAYGKSLVDETQFKIEEKGESIYYFENSCNIQKKDESNNNNGQFYITNQQTGRLDQIVKIQEYTKESKKAFLFLSFQGFDEHIFSIEVISLKKEKGHVQFQKVDDLKSKLDNSKDSIVRFSPKEDRENEVFVVAIKIGPKTNRDYDALKNYIVSADNRTYNEVVRNLTRIEYVVKKDKADEIKKSNQPYNMLVYGAPGTGKSHMLDELVEAELNSTEIIVRNIDEKKDNQQRISDLPKNLDNISEFKKQFVKRVTFYEDYSYENFVGCYKAKPIYASSNINLEYNGNHVNGTVDENKVSYGYEAGPFIEIYVKAKNDPEHNYYFFIEEINRAKAASVFGDMFQLLDRENGESKYDITPEPALREYLYENVSEYKENGTAIDDVTMKLPNNMYLWATMNSADQGVFTLDSAFKRRWEFKYKDIVGFERGKNICLIHDNKPQYINWDVFRTAINNKILEYGLDEDRCIGAYYFSDDELVKIEQYTCEENEEKKRSMVNPLVDKLLSYLKQDVFRMDDTEIFNNDNNKKCNMSSLRARVLYGENIDEILKIDINNVAVDDSLKKWLDTDDIQSNESRKAAEDVILDNTNKKEELDE